MWFSPASLVIVSALSSLSFLAPTDVTLAVNATSASTPTPAPDDGVAAVVARVSACDAPTLTLPDSIELEDGLEPAIRWALEHSPTFRQQCRALAASFRLRARVGVSYPPATGTLRARTSITETPSGVLTARIEILSVLDLTELIAHELEHVLEQLDGVNLQALAQTGGARRLADGAFETARAVAAGRQVAGEVVNNAPDRMRRAGASLWRGLRRAVGAQRRSRAQ
jgi:hypothetical protein